MPELTAQERLQPSLLDRLVDFQPQHKVEPPESRVMTKQSLRQAVLRAQAQSQRSVKSILPHSAQPTYGPQAGRAYGSTGGAGQGYLRA